MIRPEFNVESPPHAVEDLEYHELVAMIEVISDPDTEEEVAGYYGELIEMTLPGGEVADLILWPAEWFRDPKMLEVDLDETEIANYLLAWTGKKLVGAEMVELPEIPASKRAGDGRGTSRM
ncbi:MAG: hypothetical protein ACSHYB_05545 [Roseibacillus sp.]